MPNQYVQKVSSLTDLHNLPNAAGLGSYNGGVFLNADGTPRLIGGFPVGKAFFIDAVAGAAANDGRSPGSAFSTFALAYAALTAGSHDLVVLLGDGATTKTARTTSALTWGQNATHLLGYTNEGLYSPRARIAPTTTCAAFSPLITISASGCQFQNLEFWHGFAAGMAAQILAVISGSRNTFRNVHFAAMGDAESAADTGSRALYISGSENLFEDCVIGIDTVGRSVANAAIQFAAGATRNVFRRCHFPIYATATTPLAVLTAAAAAMDRFNIFEDCVFYNAGTSTQAALATLAANSGGKLLFVNPAVAAITGYGTDATSRGQILVMGASGTAASTGLAVAPTA